MYAFAPEKPPSLVGRNFCLAIVRVFAKASMKRKPGIPPEKTPLSSSPKYHQVFQGEIFSERAWVVD
jgi:hypothetical protein